MNELDELLKFCRIRGAILTGHSPEDYIGPICEKVTYNGDVIVIKTSITADDITRYSVTTV